MTPDLSHLAHCGHPPIMADLRFLRDGADHRTQLPQRLRLPADRTAARGLSGERGLLVYTKGNLFSLHSIE